MQKMRSAGRLRLTRAKGGSKVADSFHAVVNSCSTDLCERQGRMEPIRGKSWRFEIDFAYDCSLAEQTCPLEDLDIFAPAHTAGTSQQL